MHAAVAVDADTFAPHSLCTAPSVAVGIQPLCGFTMESDGNLQETGRFVEAGISINSGNGSEVRSVSQERHGCRFESRRSPENLVMISERKIRN